MQQQKNVPNAMAASPSSLEAAMIQIAKNRAKRDVMSANKTINTSIEKGSVFMKTPTVKNLTINSIVKSVKQTMSWGTT